MHIAELELDMSTLAPNRCRRKNRSIHLGLKSSARLALSTLIGLLTSWLAGGYDSFELFSGLVALESGLNFGGGALGFVLGKLLHKLAGVGAC